MPNFNLTYQNDGENEQLYYKDAHNNDLYIRSCEDFAPAIIQEKSGNPITLTDAANCPIRKLKVTFEPIQEGSGDPSPDNIRPITGRDTVTAVRTGGNLWGGEALKDDVLAKVTGATADTTNKTVSYSASNVSSVLLLNGVFFKPSTQYTLIFKGDNTSATVKYLNLQVNYTDGTHYNNLNFTDGVCVFTSPAGKTIQSIQGVWGTGTTTLYYDESGIFEGALTAADFIPYDGASVTIQLGQTVYGGTVDVMSGDMVVDRAMADLGTLTWQTNMVGNNTIEIASRDLASIKAKGITNLVCNMLPTLNQSSATDDGRFGIRGFASGGGVAVKMPKTVVSSTEEAIAWIQSNHPMMCYELATPTALTLDSASLSALKGENTFSTDGTTIELEYVVDTKTYIDNLINSNATTVVNPNNEIKIIDENKGVE